MASKISPQNLIDLQFIAEQFNAVTSPATFTTFLQAVIDAQEAILSARLGSTVFDSTTSAIANQVKRTSLCLCAAELLQLRINRLSGNIDPNSGMLISTIQKAQANYLKEADEKTTRLVTSGGSADSGGYSCGVVVTGHGNFGRGTCIGGFL